MTSAQEGYMAALRWVLEIIGLQREEKPHHRFSHLEDLSADEVKRELTRTVRDEMDKRRWGFNR